MNKKSISFIFFIALTTYASHASQSLFIGTIQFPATLKSVPGIRIYYSGHKITCDTNDETRQLIFSIPKMEEHKKFFLLITERIQFETEENTVKFLKTTSGMPYKLYTFELVKREIIPNDDPEQDGKHLHTPEPKTTYIWQIEETYLDDITSKIPDNAIIVCYTPDYIERLEGGSAVELPRIIVKENLLEIAGSEKNIHDSATRLLLSVIDYDTLHRKIEQAVKNDLRHNKTIIACKTR